MPIFEARVAASLDDAEEKSTGAMTLTGDLDIAVTDRYAAFRWDNVTIPNGATIDTAWIQFTAIVTQTGTDAATDIYGEDADDPVAFTSTNSDISNRVATTAVVNWDAIPVWTAGDETLNQRTPELKTIIQEIVDRGGWVSGQAMVIVTGPEATNGGDWKSAYSYDDDTTKAPQLHIEYTTASNVDIAVPLETFTISNKVPSIVLDVVVNVPVGTFTISNQTPSIVLDVAVNSPLDTFTISDQTPSIVLDAAVNVPVDTFTISNQTPSIVLDAAINVPVDTFTISDFIPSIVTTSDVNIIVPLELFTIADQVPLIPIDRIITVPTDSFTVSDLLASITIVEIDTPGSVSHENVGSDLSLANGSAGLELENTP